MHLQVIYKTLWLYKHENLFLLYENWYNTSNLIKLLQLSNLLQYSKFSYTELGWEGFCCVVTINVKKK